MASLHEVYCLLCVSPRCSALSALRAAKRFLHAKRKSSRSKASSGLQIRSSRPGRSTVTIPCSSMETVKASFCRTCTMPAGGLFCFRCAMILGSVGSSSFCGDEGKGWMGDSWIIGHILSVPYSLLFSFLFAQTLYHIIQARAARLIGFGGMTKRELHIRGTCR